MWPNSTSWKPILPCRNERKFWGVCNPKIEFSEPWRLHPPNLCSKKNCHTDPLPVLMSLLSLGATARSHFNGHTPLSGRRERAVPSCVFEHCLCLHACPHAYPSLLFCVGRVHICHFWKGIKGQSVEKGVKKRCLHESERGRKHVCVCVWEGWGRGGG